MRSEFSKRLAMIVADSGMTQIDFASSIGCDRKSVNGWLNGRCQPHLHALQRICKVHHVSASWLLGLEDDVKEAVQRR